MNALSVRGLVKTYKNGVQALKGIDLDVEQGDFFALLGPEWRRQDHADRHRHVAGQQDGRHAVDLRPRHRS